MSKHEYKPGDKVTFAVSREHFIDNVGFGEDIAENCFDESGVAEVESIDGGVYLAGLISDDGTYLDYGEVDICIKPHSEPAPSGLTPETDRERMLCYALLRKCRGENVEINISDTGWKNAEQNLILLGQDVQYRPAKKLPEIPWEWIDKKYNACVVDVDGAVGLKTSLSSHATHIQSGIKLDLTGVTLPVNIERPEGYK